MAKRRRSTLGRLTPDAKRQRLLRNAQNYHEREVRLANIRKSMSELRERESPAERSNRLSYNRIAAQARRQKRKNERTNVPGIGSKKEYSALNYEPCVDYKNDALGNLVENLPEPGIEPRISGSMENMCSHEESEDGRRPSRKAALAAAKKIFNAVQSKPKKSASVYVGLQMECCDDLLSPIQAEFLIKAQVQYNMAMKKIRELMACNVKVNQTNPFGLSTAVAPVPNAALKTINVPSNVIFSRTKPIIVGTLLIPMALSLASSQPSPKL